MQRSRSAHRVVGYSLLAILTSAASAQEDVTQEAPTETAGTGPASPWRARFDTWIWITGIDGDVGVGDRVADVSAGFGDILEASNSVFAFNGRLSIGKGRWGGFIDGAYANLGVDDQSGPLDLADIDVTFETVILDFGAEFWLGEWEPSGDAAANPRDITLDLYAGARLSSVDVELDPENAATRSDGAQWIDPIIGAMLVLPLAERWHLDARGDVGGFGVESDFTWSTMLAIGYDFQILERPASVFAGYRALGQDFDEGGDPNDLVWDVVQHGPVLGFSLSF